MVAHVEERICGRLNLLDISVTKSITFSFESKVSATLLKYLPRIRGSALLGQILFSLLPLNKRVIMNI